MLKSIQLDRRLFHTASSGGSIVAGPGMSRRNPIAAALQTRAVGKRRPVARPACFA